MKEEKVYFFKTLPSGTAAESVEKQAASMQDLPTTGTCIEAETFALRVLDESMQPEFRKGCIIVIDPTGRATDGSYVLARLVDETTQPVLDAYVFRQLRRLPELQDGVAQWQLSALNEQFPAQSTASDLSSIVGVIVQRAGIRRRYHKHYS